MRDNKFYIGRWRSGWCSSFSDAEQGSNLVSNKNPKTFFSPLFSRYPNSQNNSHSLFSLLSPQTPNPNYSLLAVLPPWLHGGPTLVGSARLDVFKSLPVADPHVVIVDPTTRGETYSD